MDEDLDRWFVCEILPHEDALVRYLARLWPNRSEVTDLRQETYIRVYVAAGRSRPTAAKSFLFATARNLLIDRVRRARIVSIEAMGDLHDSNVLLDELSPERHAVSRQELQRLAHAFDRLPPRCRQIVWLRKVEGLSQKEVAARLGIGEKTIEKQVMKGVQLLADGLANGEGAHGDAHSWMSGRGHGKQQTD